MTFEFITLGLCQKFAEAYLRWYREYINETINPALIESEDYIADALKNFNLTTDNIKALQKLYQMWIGYDMECHSAGMPSVDIAFYMYAHRYFIDRL